MRSDQIKKRKNEKGAAMVMVLLISLLLLTASAGLLMESSMNTQNVSDATAEQQAYNAAESGLQSTINALRGNVVADPLIDSSKPATDPVNLINFRKATTPSISNENYDSTGYARLSRWLKYNYSSTGGLNKDRILLGVNASSFNPSKDFAYSVTITDPDNTGDAVSFNTMGQFYDTQWRTGSFTKTVGGATVTISYESALKSALNVSSGSLATDFGKFKIVRSGSGEIALGDDIRFQIVVNMTVPYNATKVMRGWIKTSKVDLMSVSSVEFDFDSPVYDLMGSSFSLKNYNDLLTVNVGSTATLIEGTITQPEPFRVLVRSVGYGPRGAKKELEAIVQKNFFNGLSAPATLTLVGADNSGFNFYAGDSQQVTYSGQNKVGKEIIPSIGTTNPGNLAKVLDNLANRGTKADIIGYPSDVAIEMPFWLQSPENLHNTLQDLKRVAISTGRYFAPGVEPEGFGNNANATGITFADGDTTLTGNGGGILVVTGKLTLHGNFNFNGLIIVTGPDGVIRTGGGTGILQGNTVIAPYNPADITPDNPNDPPAQFLAPKYDISGGGNSEIIYNSSSVANGMTAVSNFVLGVAEK